MNEPLWGEMLDVLKDIGEYLAKSDTNQEAANIDKAPKIGEGGSKPIKGGENGPFGPGKNALIAKEFPGVMNEPRVNEQENIDAKEGTLLKGEDLEQLEEDEDQVNGDVLADEGEDEEPRGEEMDPELELRSLLKDIRSALITKSSKTKETSKETSKKSDSVSKAMVNEIVAEIKKSLPSIVNAESHRMLRKMGFSPSRPDIVRFGVDEDIKKSEDGEGVGLDIKKATDDLSKKSWGELGAIREKLGGFNAFQ